MAGGAALVLEQHARHLAGDLVQKVQLLLQRLADLVLGGDFLHHAKIEQRLAVLAVLARQARAHPAHAAVHVLEAVFDFLAIHALARLVEQFLVLVHDAGAGLLAAGDAAHRHAGQHIHAGRPVREAAVGGAYPVAHLGQAFGQVVQRQLVVQLLVELLQGGFAGLQGGLGGVGSAEVGEKNQVIQIAGDGQGGTRQQGPQWPAILGGKTHLHIAQPALLAQRRQPLRTLIQAGPDAQFDGGTAQRLFAREPQQAHPFVVHIDIAAVARPRQADRQRTLDEHGRQHGQGLPGVGTVRRRLQAGVGLAQRLPQQAHGLVAGRHPLILTRYGHPLPLFSAENGPAGSRPYPPVSAQNPQFIASRWNFVSISPILRRHLHIFTRN